MKRNTFFKGLIIAVVLICGVVSCATGTVYLKDVNKYTSTTFKSEIDWDVYTFTWGDYKLVSDSQTKEKKIDFSKYGMADYDSKSGFISDFKKSKKLIYEVVFLSGTKKLSKDKIVKNASENYIVIDKTKLKVNPSTESVIISDNSYMPVKVTPINQMLRDGKVYNMLANANAGVKINLYGQDYAVVDYISETPTILMNNKFNKELTQEETDFAAALLLSLYELNQTYSGFSD
jgi:hypothetical protein